MTEVKAAHGSVLGFVLTTKERVTQGEPESTYERDAALIVRFLDQLPSGTVDRVKAILNSEPRFEVRGKSQEVAEYLGKLRGVRNTRPVKVTIGKETWEGAYYEWGELTAWRPRFYLLGEVPKSKQRGNVCFPHEDKEWFVGGGYTPYLCKPFKSHGKGDPSDLPFGDHFDISLWEVPDGTKIDHYEDKPYKRIPMTVEYLDA